MRRRLPTDAAICLVLALLISYGVGALAERISDRSFERKKEELAPVSGEIGAEADDAVYRAESVEDMLSHDTFTIEIPSDNALSQARGYHNGMEVKNNFSGKLRTDKNCGFPLTDKADASEHGIGFYNIRMTAEKYHGAVDWSAKDGMFSLTVMLEDTRG